MPDLSVVPVTPDRWADLEALFGRRGAYSGCWCMWFRQTTAEWEAAGAGGRRAELSALVGDGRRPGLLAYRDGRPVGWVAVAPRAEHHRLTSPRARAYRPLDDTPTWVVTCFYVAAGQRKTGVATRLLDAAVEFAAANGATVVEGYPVDDAGPQTDSHAFTGTLPMFARAGFVEVQRSYGRPLVRRRVG